MPDIPGFPRKFISRRETFDLYIDNTDMDGVVAALQDIKTQYLNGATFKIRNLIVHPKYAYTHVMVQEPESDEAYEARHAKWQQELANLGFTEKRMERCLKKVNKALSKLSEKENETIH